MGCTETLIPTRDAHRLFVRDYRPLAPPVTRTLLVVHGMSEHGQRYEHVARIMTGRGWRVVTVDLRGHGRSDGVRTHVGSFKHYVQDVETARAGLDLDPQQTALLGHSMGGLVSIRYAQTFPEHVAALVLSSPLLGVGVPIPRRTVALGRVLSVIAPRTRFRSRIDPESITRSTDVLARRADDPLIHRSLTARWFFAMRAALNAAWRDAHRVTVPLLVVQAGADRIVSPHATRGWFEQTASADKTYRCLPDHYHEVLNEPDWPETLADIADWLEGHLP